MAAQFTHAGKDYHAFRFDQDKALAYYDAEGQSLQKAFLKSPMKYSRVTSRFTYSRFHPVLKIRRPHLGVDYGAPTGTPVYTIGDGVVVKREYGSGPGNYIVIKHNGTYTTKYLHLSKFASGIHAGARVKQGQIVGYVGSTGLATGPHLHFTVVKNGKVIDPLRMDLPPSEPVNKDNLAEFNALKSKMMARLDKIEFTEVEEVPLVAGKY